MGVGRADEEMPLVADGGRDGIRLATLPAFEAYANAFGQGGAEVGIVFFFSIEISRAFGTRERAAEFSAGLRPPPIWAGAQIVVLVAPPDTGPPLPAPAKGD